MVGDLDANAERIADAMDWAEGCEADLLVLPELALTGYPLEDLAVRGDFSQAAAETLAELAKRAGSATTVVGTIDPVTPRRSWDTRTRDVSIGAALLCDGEVRGVYDKVLLPNYEVFNEARNFAPGTAPGALWRVGETTVGISICEDSWSDDGPPEAQAAGGAQLLVVQNASPFTRGKADRRLEHCARLARRNGLPVVYVNSVGGQDELVFDGGSLVLDAAGELLHRAPQFEPARFCFDLAPGPGRSAPVSPRSIHVRPARPREPRPAPSPAAQLGETEQIWRALVVGVRDFAHRNGTREGVVAISGGIDSALTAALAADALGAERILAVSIPVAGTPEAELDDARELAANLGIELQRISIEASVEGIGEGIAVTVGDESEAAEGRTRAALLARTRAAVLQAVADSLGRLALATVNKTELSVGSSTLHAAMAGGFAPLKDCPKTLVYELARHRNERGLAIPERIIERTPTALNVEDLSLSSFEEIDRILVRRLENGDGLEGIVAAGFEAELARGVLQLIDGTEQLRRQSPPGVKITSRAFGMDRRMPITNGWQPFRREGELIAPGVSAGPVAAPGRAG